MATGDDALAAGMDILTGNEQANTLDTEENKTRDYIAQRTNLITPIAKGGTGATTAPAARSALGIELAAPGTVEVNKVCSYNAAGRLISNAPVNPADVATKSYVDGFWAADPLWLNSVNVQGQLYLLASTPVTSGYAAAYINVDGRVGKTPSARRFKKDITDHHYSVQDALGIRLRTYRLRADVYGSTDAPVEVGVIAEELEDAGLSEFVHYGHDGRPESVHYERLALVALGALQELAARVTALESR